MRKRDDHTWFTSPAVVMVRLYADEAVTLWGKWKSLTSGRCAFGGRGRLWAPVTGVTEVTIRHGCFETARNFFFAGFGEFTGQFFLTIKHTERTHGLLCFAALLCPLLYMQIKSERSPAERVETHCSDLCKTSLLLASLSSTDDDKMIKCRKNCRKRSWELFLELQKNRIELPLLC